MTQPPVLCWKERSALGVRTISSVGEGLGGKGRVSERPRRSRRVDIPGRGAAQASPLAGGDRACLKEGECDWRPRWRGKYILMRRQALHYRKGLAS